MGDQSARNEGPVVEVSESQLHAIAALVGGATMTAAAERAGVGRTTLYRWHQDARFLYGLNRAKLEHRAEIRGELRALAAQAVQALRDVLGSEQSAPALRARTAMNILNAVGVGHPEYIDPPPSPVPQRPWVFVDRLASHAPDFNPRSDR